MENVSCLHPVKILHPSYIDMFMKYDTIVMYDSHFAKSYVLPITPYSRLRLFEYGETLFKVFPVLSNHKDFASVILFDSETGEGEDLFLEVPCGHCSACESRKYNGIVQRLTLAQEEFDTKPLFITLTYNDLHLPSDGVSKRDIQLFKKRFNKLIYSLYHCRLKYAVFSEYGKLGRPHYHLILYNYPYTKSDYFVYCRILRELNFCWRSFPKSGFHRAERFDFMSYCRQNYKLFDIRKGDKVDPFSMGFINLSFANDGNVISYVTKYVTKGSNVPSGKNKNFRSLSIRLGLDFVKSKRDFILHSDDSTLTYKPKFSDKVVKLHLTKYYINYLFPSFSRLVPVEFRRSWLGLMTTSLWIVRNDILPITYRKLIYYNLLRVSQRFPTLCKIVDIESDKKSMFPYAVLRKFRLEESDKCCDDIASDLKKWYDYFESFPSDYELFVSKQVLERDQFLSHFGNTFDPLLSGIKYLKTLSINQSKTKL